jgi:hypothetical protein
MNGRNACRDLECPGRRLKWRHMYRLYRHGSGVRIEHDCGALEPGRDLREQLKPLACQRGFEGGEAGDVPTRAVTKALGLTAPPSILLRAVTAVSISTSIIAAAARNNVPAVYWQSVFAERRLALLRSRPSRHPSSRRHLE